VKKEIPQKEVALESSSPNYKTLGAIVCATAAVLYAVYKYYPRRQQESFARYSIEHFYNTAWTEEPRPRWKKPPSRKMAVEMRWDLMIEG